MGMESAMGIESANGMRSTMVMSSTLGMGFTMASTKSRNAKVASDPMCANMSQGKCPLKEKKKNVHF